MNIAASRDRRLEVTSTTKRGSLNEPRDLTLQEIEAGLKSLHISLQRGRLPFIILIEDDDQEAFLFKSALRRARVAVEFMHLRDGRQAMDFFHGRGGFSDRDMFPLPNVTVLDFKLTRGSGLKILEEIRSSPHLEQLVVVGLTASEDRKELDQARHLKINDCIRKPQSLPALVEVVQQIKNSWLSANN